MLTYYRQLNRTTILNYDIIIKSICFFRIMILNTTRYNIKAKHLYNQVLRCFWQYPLFMQFCNTFLFRVRIIILLIMFRKLCFFILWKIFFPIWWKKACKIGCFHNIQFLWEKISFILKTLPTHFLNHAMKMLLRH